MLDLLSSSSRNVRSRILTLYFSATATLFLFLREAKEAVKGIGRREHYFAAICSLKIIDMIFKVVGFQVSYIQYKLKGLI